MKPSTINWLRDLLEDDVAFDVPLAPYTTFRIGGPADALAQPPNVETLKALVSGLSKRQLTFCIMGGGSNLLVQDGGFRGVVIVLKRRFGTISRIASADQTERVRVGAGVKLPVLCAWSIKHGLAGLTFATGIPGCVGGAVKMNAGTQTGCMADVVTAVTVMEKDGQTHELPVKALHFSYRASSLSEDQIIVNAKLALKKGDPHELTVMTRQMKAKRNTRQPTGVASAGSFFKNPDQGPSAGELLDGAGLKGARMGQAEIAVQHANWIVNQGGATAADVLRLAKRAQRRVAEKYGVQLEFEVRVVGEPKGGCHG